jgi:hypothetical protein
MNNRLSMFCSSVAADAVTAAVAIAIATAVAVAASGVADIANVSRRGGSAHRHRDPA